MYLALKRMKQGDRYVEYGEPIDTSDWKYRVIVQYEMAGLIKHVPDAPTAPAKETSRGK